MKLVLRIEEKLLRVIYSLNKILLIPFYTILTVSCSTPVYKEVENENISSEHSLIYDTITYYVADEFKKYLPTCIFIPPFVYDENFDTSKEISGDIRFSSDELLRRSVYAHISLLPYRDIELERVDFLINQENFKDKINYYKLSQLLTCDIFLLGTLKEFKKEYIGLYSEISLGLNLKIFRSIDKTLLWESEHIFKNRGGSVPLSPIGIAFGIYDASENVSDENILSMVDDLSRRMISTIPEVQDNISSTYNNKLFSKDNYFVKNYNLNKIIVKNNKEVSHKNFLNIIIEGNLSLKEANILYSNLIKSHGLNLESGKAYSLFLLRNGSYEKALKNILEIENLYGIDSSTRAFAGRVYLKLNRENKAKEAFIKAISLDPDNVLYYNCLGSTFIQLKNYPKAKAAFKMALYRESLNGYALYNTGIIYFIEGNYDLSSVFLTNAGMSYIEKNDKKSVALILSMLEKFEGIDYSFDKKLQNRHNILKNFIRGEVND